MSYVHVIKNSQMRLFFLSFGLIAFFNMTRKIKCKGKQNIQEEIGVKVKK